MNKEEIRNKRKELNEQDFVKYVETLSEIPSKDVLYILESISFPNHIKILRKFSLSFEDFKFYLLLLKEHEMLNLLELDLTEEEILYLLELCSFETKMKYFEKNKDKIQNSKKIYLFLQTFSDDEAVLFVSEFYEKFTMHSLENLFYNNNSSHLLSLLDQHFELFENEQIKKFLLNKSDEIKTFILEKEPYFEKEYFFSLLFHLKSEKEKIRYLKKYFQKFDENQIATILYSLTKSEDIITFLEENPVYFSYTNFTKMVDKSEHLKKYFLSKKNIQYFKKNYLGNDREILELMLKSQVSKVFFDHINSLDYEKYLELLDGTKKDKNYALWKDKEIYLVLDDRFSYSVRQKVLQILNDDFILTFEIMTGYDFLFAIQYLLNNENLDVIIHVVKNQSKEFKKVYSFIKSEMKENEKYPFYSLIRVAKFVQKYPMLCKDEEPFKDEDKLNLLYLIYSNDQFEIITKSSLRQVSWMIDNQINDAILSDSISSLELKDIFLKYVCNMSFKEVQDILDNSINPETLQKILAKNLEKEEREVVEVLNSFICFLNETLNSTNDINSLKRILLYINTEEKRNLYENIYKYFSNIKELIREVYEIDANASLTRLDQLPEELLDKKTNIYDLSQSSYALYVHMVDPSFDLKNLVLPKFRGQTFLCLTPISDFNRKELFDEALGREYIGILYDYLPQGSFIGSSIFDAGSNSKIVTNNFDLSNISYHQFEIKDSSSISTRTFKDTSETDVYRDKMIPSGILIKGDIPTENEIKAKQTLEELLGKKIYFVKVQNLGVKVADPKEMVQKKEKIERKNQLKDLKKELETLKEIEVKKDDIIEIRNVKVEKGATHNLYKAKINGENYLLKPAQNKDMDEEEILRNYAAILGYEMQKLINPKGAIEVKSIHALLNGEKILCSAVKLIDNAYDFSFLDKQYFSKDNYIKLSQNEIAMITKEFIVDYLIFNFDVKGANFICDGNNIYGVDKEQALKFALKTKYMNLSYDVNSSNSLQSMYKNVFEAYIEDVQEIDDSIFEELFQIGKKIVSMGNEEYLKMFLPYIKESSSDEDMFSLYVEKILYRKNHLYQELENFVSKLKEQKERRCSIKI